MLQKESELNTLHASLAAVQTSLKEKEESLAAAAERYTSLQSEHETLAASHAEVKAHAKKHITALKAQVDDLQKERDAHVEAREISSTLHANISNDLAAIQEKHAALISTHSVLSTSMDKVTQEHETYITAITKVHESRIQAQQEELAHAKNSTTAELDSKNCTIKELEEKITRLLERQQSESAAAQQ